MSNAGRLRYLKRKAVHPHWDALPILFQVASSAYFLVESVAAAGAVASCAGAAASFCWLAPNPGRLLGLVTGFSMFSITELSVVAVGATHAQITLITTIADRKSVV